MKFLDASSLDGLEAGIVKKDGKIIGCFLPFSSQSLPRKSREIIVRSITSGIAEKLAKRGLTEDDVINDLKRGHSHYTR